MFIINRITKETAEHYVSFFAFFSLDHLVSSISRDDEAQGSCNGEV